MVEIKPGEYWRVMVKVPFGEDFRGGLFRRSLFVVSIRYPEWILHGECGRCGVVQDFAERMKSLTRDYYEDQGLLVMPYPAEFEVELLDRLELDESTQAISHIPPERATKILFRGVRWSRIGCTVEDSLCSGKAEFSCDSFQISEFEDANTLVVIEEHKQ